MKIVIHGTKGGYHIFTSERIPGFIDARPDYNKVAAIGQEAYAINFNNYNAVLSKYKIIRDVAGEKRMGNVAFSVIIPNNKKFSGADAKDLLDKLSTWYCAEYVDGDNLKNEREDWKFVDDVTVEFENKLKSIPSDEVESIQQGTGEAAFVYYSTKEELEKYLAEPYQQEYKRFKQIFFVKSDLEGQAENPLNALRHNQSSNLTGQIDLSNPWYKLLFNENTKSGVKIEVLANGLRCKNNSKIRRKTDLEISYSKQYHHEESITSKWDEINAEFVDVNDAAQTITIREKELTPITKPIKFEVKDGKKKTISDADVFCVNYRSKEERKVDNNEIVFKAEEIKDKWTIYGKKNNIEGQIEFIPENQPENIVLVLTERKIVRITARDVDTRETITGFKIEISKKIRCQGGEMEFVGDDINEKWLVTILHHNYETKIISYCPATDDNPKDVRLRKMQPSPGEGKNKKPYNVNAGHHGTLKDGNDYTSNKLDGSDVIDRIVPNKGYEFLKFELINDTLIAYYKKKVWYKNPIIIITIVVLCSIVIFAALNSGLFSRPKDISGEIIGYCDGNELNEEHLKNYKKTYCLDSKPPEYCKKINNAIEIRKAINEGNIDLLKTFEYSISQDSLKKAVNNINEKFIEKIGNTLQRYPASDLNLLQVTDIITKLQKLLLINVNNLRSERDCDDRLQLIKGLGLREDLPIVKSIKEQIDAKKNTFTSKEESQTVHTTSKSEPTPDTHKSHQPTTQTGSGKSAFELKFWTTVNNGIEKKETYDALRQSYNGQNATPADMAILNYLKVITKDSDAFKKFLRVPALTRKTANSLTDIRID